MLATSRSRLGNEADVLGRALASATRIPGVVAAEVGLIDGDRVVGTSVNGGAPTGFARPLGDGSPLTDAALHGRPVEGELAGVFRVSEPIQLNGRVCGALMASFGHRNGFAHAWLSDVAESTGLALENLVLASESESAVREVVSVLAAIIEGRDAYTESHCVHMAEGALAVGLRLGLDDAGLENLTFGGLLHDVGKIALPDAILSKPGPLAEDEYLRMQSHAAIGQSIIARIRHLADVAPIVGQHHERFDGTGYPEGLAGSSIILEARILAVVDTFDAMTSTRPYRAALPWSVATEEISHGRGTSFDPEAVDAFLAYIHGEEVQWTNNSPT